MAKKDWRKYKQAQEKGRPNSNDDNRQGSNAESAQEDAPPHYHPEMDEMRCILYTHGGEYLYMYRQRVVHIFMKAVTTLAVLTKSDMPFSDMPGRSMVECLVCMFCMTAHGFLTVCSHKLQTSASISVSLRLARPCGSMYVTNVFLSFACPELVSRFVPDTAPGRRIASTR